MSHARSVKRDVASLTRACTGLRVHLVNGVPQRAGRPNRAVRRALRAGAALSARERTGGVRRVAGYCLMEMGRSVELDAERIVNGARAFAEAFRAVPRVAAYLSRRQPMRLHAFFVEHNAVV